jgi:hypothetical protein
MFTLVEVWLGFFIIVFGCAVVSMVYYVSNDDNDDVSSDTPTTPDLPSSWLLVDGDQYLSKKHAKLLQGFSKDYTVVFVVNNCPKLSPHLTRLMQAHTIEVLSIRSMGKEASDNMIAMQVVRLLSLNPSAKVDILSNDADFRDIISFASRIYPNYIGRQYFLKNLGIPFKRLKSTANYKPTYFSYKY